MASRSRKNSKKGQRRSQYDPQKRVRLLSHRLRQDDRRRWKGGSGAFLYHDGTEVNYDLDRDYGSDKERTDRTRSRISFQVPKKVEVCRKRKRRRETLFRQGKVGKGKKVSKIRRRNESSDIKC